MALTFAAKEATWLRLLLIEQGLLDETNQHSKIILKGNNQSAIALASNPVLHQQTKHIDIQHHYIRDKVNAKRIKICYVPTSKIVADRLTKPLVLVKYHTFIKQLEMFSLTTSTSTAPSTSNIHV